MAHLRHPRRLPVLLCGAIIGSLAVAGIVISSAGAAAIQNADVPCNYAQFNHGNPAMKLEGNLVPIYKKVNQNATSTLQHNAPLAQGGRPPVYPNTTFGAVNGVSSWCFSVTYQKNQANACVAGIPAGASDVCLDVNMTKVVNAGTTVENNQSLQVVAIIRFSDNKFCSPFPCSGPFTQAGTAKELPFGPLPVTCAGAAPNVCSFHASANAAIPGSVQNGFKSNVQIFRVQVLKSGSPVAQQGIAWP
jgi:hypothetical protein